MPSVLLGQVVKVAVDDAVVAGTDTAVVDVVVANVAEKDSAKVVREGRLFVGMDRVEEMTEDTP